MRLPFCAALCGWSLLASASPVPSSLHQLSVEQLDDLPGVGPKTALAIVVSAQEHGPFATWEELQQIEGVGEGLVAAIRARTRLGPSVGSPTPDRGQPPLDPNLVNPASLTHWPGISLSTATRIVAFRDENGFFGSCHDLIQVGGIGPATLALIEDRCQITP